MEGEHRPGREGRKGKERIGKGRKERKGTEIYLLGHTSNPLPILERKTGGHRGRGNGDKCYSQQKLEHGKKLVIIKFFWEIPNFLFFFFFFFF